MDKRSQEAWKHEALEMVFSALAHNRTLVSRLIFKGARVLNRRLKDNSRQSLDLDANLREEFLREYPGASERAQALADALRRGITNYLAEQESTPYTLESVTVNREPWPGEHPFGWDGMKAHIRLHDARHAQVLGLPALEIDFSAPEPMGARGVAPLHLNDGVVEAESLARMTGEKLRAFLQSLPAWRAKIGSRPRAVRVRDLFDLKRVAVTRPLSDASFWDEVGAQFSLACESRAVDCHGVQTFAEQLEVTRTTFESDTTIPKTWSFDELWRNLKQIVEHLEQSGVVPMTFPVPHR